MESNRDRSAYQPNGLPPGQTGSRDRVDDDDDDVGRNVLRCRAQILGTTASKRTDPLMYRDQFDRL